MWRPNSDQNKCEKEKQKHKKRNEKTKQKTLINLSKRRIKNPIDSGSKLMC